MMRSGKKLDYCRSPRDLGKKRITEQAVIEGVEGPESLAPPPAAHLGDWNSPYWVLLFSLS